MIAVLDLNIILDVITSRAPFVNESRAVWDAHEIGKFNGLIAATELTNLFYIVRRLMDADAAMKGVESCLQAFPVIAVDYNFLQAAATMIGKDFEDNVVIACAESIAADYIVTRDETGFAHSSVPAISPPDFIALFEQ